LKNIVKQGSILEHFVSAKTLFVLKHYEIENASIMSPHADI